MPKKGRKKTETRDYEPRGENQARDRFPPSKERKGVAEGETCRSILRKAL